MREREENMFKEDRESVEEEEEEEGEKEERRDDKRTIKIVTERPNEGWPPPAPLLRHPMLWKTGFHCVVFT